MRFKYIFIVVSILTIFTSCIKEEGFGGLATISGKVYAYDYNNSGVLIAEGYTGDIDVYIRAKGSNVELNRIRTTYDGTFAFKQLRKGDYEVWVYSDCAKCPNGIEPIIQSVALTNKKENLELSVFEVNI